MKFQASSRCQEICAPVVNDHHERGNAERSCAIRATPLVSFPCLAAMRTCPKMLCMTPQVGAIGQQLRPHLATAVELACTAAPAAATLTVIGSTLATLPAVKPSHGLTLNKNWEHSSVTTFVSRDAHEGHDGSAVHRTHCSRVKLYYFLVRYTMDMLYLCPFCDDRCERRRPQSRIGVGFAGVRWVLSVLACGSRSQDHDHHAPGPRRQQRCIHCPCGQQQRR